MRKRIISAILSVTMVMGAVPVTMFGSAANSTFSEVSIASETGAADKGNWYTDIYGTAISSTSTVSGALTLTASSKVSAGTIIKRDPTKSTSDPNNTLVAKLNTANMFADDATGGNQDLYSRSIAYQFAIPSGATTVSLEAGGAEFWHVSSSGTWTKLDSTKTSETISDGTIVLYHKAIERIDMNTFKIGGTVLDSSKNTDNGNSKTWKIKFSASSYDDKVFTINSNITYATQNNISIASEVGANNAAGVLTDLNWYEDIFNKVSATPGGLNSSVNVYSKYYSGQAVTDSALANKLITVNGWGAANDTGTNRTLAFEITAPTGATKVINRSVNGSELYYYDSTGANKQNVKEVRTNGSDLATNDRIITYIRTMGKDANGQWIANGSGCATSKSWTMEFFDTQGLTLGTYTFTANISYQPKPTDPDPVRPTPSPSPSPAPVKPVDPKVNENGSVNSSKAAEAAAASKTGTVTIQNAKSVSSDTLKSIEKAAEKSGKDATLVASATVGNKVVAKLTIDCANADKFAKNIKLGVNTSNTAKAAVAKKMKSFANDIQTLRLEQRTTFGAPVKISFKLDTKKIDPKKVVAYVLDPKTNKLTKVKCTVTKSGTITVTTKMGGDIVISEGKLTKK